MPATDRAPSVLGQPTTTWADLARLVFPDATDPEIDFLLWERTAFPMASANLVMHQLRVEADDAR